MHAARDQAAAWGCAEVERCACVFRADADVHGAIGAVVVEAVERQIVDDVVGDDVGRCAAREQVARLAKARADRRAAPTDLAAGVLIQPRRDAALNLLREPRARKAIGEHQWAEVVGQWIEDRLGQMLQIGPRRMLAR